MGAVFSHEDYNSWHPIPGDKTGHLQLIIIVVSCWNSCRDLKEKNPHGDQARAWTSLLKSAQTESDHTNSGAAASTRHTIDTFLYCAVPPSAILPELCSGTVQYSTAGQAWLDQQIPMEPSAMVIMQKLISCYHVREANMCKRLKRIINNQYFTYHARKAGREEEDVNGGYYMVQTGIFAILQPTRVFEHMECCWELVTSKSADSSFDGSIRERGMLEGLSLHIL